MHSLLTHHNTYLNTDDIHIHNTHDKHTYIHTYMNVHVHIYTHIHANTHTHIYIYTYIYIHKYIHTYTHIRDLVIQFIEAFTVMLSPYCPHIAQSLWNKIGKVDSSFNICVYMYV